MPNLPELWQDFRDIAAQVISKTSRLPQDKIDTITQALLDTLIKEWGGMSLYIPKSDYLDRIDRNQAIFEAYDGTPESISRLSRKYKLTNIYVYRIIERMRKHKQRIEKAEGTTSL